MKKDLGKWSRSIALLPLTFVAPLMSFSVGAQETKVSLPKVATISVPAYPPLARAAHVEGIVHIKVKTDGQRVTNTKIEDGHKLLAASAEENVKSWHFLTGEPATFTVTYRYQFMTGLKGDPSSPAITLRLPSEVQVSTVPLNISDPGVELK